MTTPKAKTGTTISSGTFISKSNPVYSLNSSSHLTVFKKVSFIMLIQSPLKASLSLGSIYILCYY